MTVNLPVLIGFILLEGIAVNNGIVMIDYVNQLVRSGVEKKEAILRGCATRLRPVLLTALTTILGMLPMAMTKSSGAEMRAPIAVTVLAGLTATTFLTLFIIPIHLQHVREGVVQEAIRARRAGQARQARRGSSEASFGCRIECGLGWTGGTGETSSSTTPLNCSRRL